MLGASERPSLGRMIIESLDRIGFPGAVYPVNTKYDALFGRRCYPSVADLPEAPDVLAPCVNHARVLEHMRLAASRGVRAAIIFDGGFAERGEEGRRRQDELVAICRQASIALRRLQPSRVLAIQLARTPSGQVDLKPPLPVVTPARTTRRGTSAA